MVCAFIKMLSFFCCCYYSTHAVFVFIQDYSIARERCIVWDIYISCIFTNKIRFICSFFSEFSMKHTQKMLLHFPYFFFFPFQQFQPAFPCTNTKKKSQTEIYIKFLHFYCCHTIYCDSIRFFSLLSLLHNANLITHIRLFFFSSFFFIKTPLVIYSSFVQSKFSDIFNVNIVRKCFEKIEIFIWIFSNMRIITKRLFSNRMHIWHSQLKRSHVNILVFQNYSKIEPFQIFKDSKKKKKIIQKFN